MPHKRAYPSEHGQTSHCEPMSPGLPQAARAATAAMHTRAALTPLAVRGAALLLFPLAEGLTKPEAEWLADAPEATAEAAEAALVGLLEAVETEEPADTDDTQAPW